MTLFLYATSSSTSSMEISHSSSSKTRMKRSRWTTRKRLRTNRRNSRELRSLRTFLPQKFFVRAQKLKFYNLLSKTFLILNSRKPQITKNWGFTWWREYLTWMKLQTKCLTGTLIALQRLTMTLIFQANLWKKTK